jgi:uncharacterized repeat protein (TIGR01451 family)
MPTKPPGTPTLDLTDAGDFGVIGDAVFTTGQVQPAGTGAFNSFVQIQRKGSEQGYNTDHSPQYDEKSSAPHNHSVLLADVPVVVGDGSNGTVEGLTYREFLLDLNEPNGGSKPYISLDALQIWQEESGNLTNFTPGSGFAGSHTNYLAYNLDAGGDHWIALTDGMSHGSGQSDYRILIPDSFFINDTAHRYVTLYSAFGQQSGWDTDGGFEEWGLHGASGGVHSALSVHKTATVPGGTADTAGEVISYAITVSNTGNTALTGVTVTDPSVSNLAPVLSSGFNIGDTNHDNQLSAGETWQYTASHTVTQDDIDTNGGGDGVIDNTVTADTNETTPVAAAAQVAVDRRPIVDLVKTADVTSVDAAGDQINYTITLTNTGNTTLTSPQVDDTQVNIVTPVVDDFAPILGPPLLAQILVGDYNIGDTNQNGFQDPGETFQYVNAGDTNQNGIQDPGETFLFTNVGDTNQNGGQDTGETFQFYNVGDTNHNGVEDSGETFQFTVSHAVAGVDANHDGLNDGDVNHDGQLNPGETWQFALTYTVTQSDIDNGGVVNPALTHDNTATANTTEGATDSGSVSVGIVQNPHITLDKTASVPGGTADAAGEVVDYSIAVTNDGNMTLTGLAVTDPSVGDLAPVLSGGFNAGDTNQDGKVGVGETWQYTASHTVTQSEMDAGGSISNTASATTDQNASSNDSASVTVEQHAEISLVKTALGYHDANANNVADAGDTIDFSFAVMNGGNVTLHDIGVADLDGAVAVTGSTITALAPGATDSTSWSGSYVIQQIDVDAGFHDNTAVANGTEASASSGTVHVVLADLMPLA